MKQETPAERLSRKAELRRAYINRGCVCVEFESEGKIITWEPDPDTGYDLTVRFAGSICEPDTDRALKIFDELEAARSAAAEREEDCAVTPAETGTVENSPETEGMTDFRGMFAVMEEAYGDRPIKSGTVGRAISKRTKERIKNAGRCN